MGSVPCCVCRVGSTPNVGLVYLRQLFRPRRRPANDNAGAPLGAPGRLRARRGVSPNPKFALSLCPVPLKVLATLALSPRLKTLLSAKKKKKKKKKKNSRVFTPLF